MKTVSENPKGSCAYFGRRSLKGSRSYLSESGGKYAEGQLEDDISEFWRVEEELEEGVEVAGGSLILETYGVPLLAWKFGHGQVICTIPGLSFPQILDLSPGFSREELIFSGEDISEHVVIIIKD